MKTWVLDKNTTSGPKVQVTVGGEEAAVKEVEGLENNEGADEGSPGSVVVGAEDRRQASRKAVLNNTERKVRVRPNTNRLATGDEVGDAEVVGKLAVLGDNADVMDGGEPEGLDSGKQGGVIDEDCNGSDFDGEAGGYFVLRSVLGPTDGVDADILMGVLVVLINARGVREDDCRRNVLLIVKMRERRQGTGRRDRSQG
jgi:hypothetical protein